VRSRVHGRERETDRAGRKNAYLNVALPTSEMEWEVQSELEWFTEDEACSERAFFFGSFLEKNDQTPVRGPPALPSLFDLGEGGQARRTFSTQKNQQQLQRIFSNRVLRWPISVATLTIDVARDKKGERVSLYAIVSRSRAKKIVDD